MKLLIILSVAFTYVQANCPEPMSDDHTTVRCTDDNFSGSECSVLCDPGFMLLPPSNSPAATCQDDDTWDNEFPFCGLVCPISAKADITFVVDSSSSMKGVTGNLMKTFLKDMIGEWTINPDYVKVAIVPYNRNIIRRGVITLDQFDNDKAGLFKAVDALPQTGGGTLTRKALEYTKDFILAEGSGNRADAPDIVIVMSDGRGQDSVDPPLQRLWDANVTTYSVGFHPRKMDMLTRQLMKIAQGNPSQMHLTGRDEVGNTKIFMNDLAEVYCEEVVEPDVEVCEPPRASLDHGDVACTNKNLVGSECAFECEDGYHLTSRSITSNTCLQTNEWDAAQPCCLLDCPPNAKMDGILILDSSSSIGGENWAMMKNFTRNFINSFTISSEATNFGVVRYNREVDTANLIYLNDYSDDKEGLLAAFDRIPYDGSGTHTGQAIQFVSDNMMSKETGNRPGIPVIVFVITDGKSFDDVERPSDELREQGATVLSIGITPRVGLLDYDQLLQIAGVQANQILVEGGFEGLEAAFESKITDLVCFSQC